MPKLRSSFSLVLVHISELTQFSPSKTLMTILYQHMAYTREKVGYINLVVEHRGVDGVAQDYGLYKIFKQIDQGAGVKPFSLLALKKPGHALHSRRKQTTIAHENIASYPEIVNRADWIKVEDTPKG
ncbi:hypothetical protein [Helicobacter sp. L8]|uniref:hypothetical protein n=1 Tax=Helicobacter sp. L8 TaxID=2316078 RepID=UPI0013CE2C7E|nr:hypothetical protein [Helicobacter sp. L8]